MHPVRPRPQRARAQGLLDFAIALSALLLVVLGILQFGLWYYAQTVVLAAAREGAHTAALEGATATDGATTAQQVVRLGLGRWGTTVQVQAATDDEVAAVTATGTLTPLVPLPGLAGGLPLHARAIVARERFRP
jgi:Flp pilus assembly protein TadG